MPKQKNQNVHVPVLLHEVVDYLAPKAGESYLDLTAGYGGHSTEIIGRTDEPASAVLVDRDENAIKDLRKTFAGKPVRIIHNDYLQAVRQLSDKGEKFDMILADLGVSSPHLEDADRGFSFNLPGPLDMRMDKSQERRADSLVNDLPEPDLVRILSEFGEEPKARSIARAIVSNRPVENTAQLAAIVAKNAGFRGRYSKTHPATKTFQALRIAVNDELTQLEESLPYMLGLLKPAGRMAIISFHSLEDRLIKQFLADNAGNRYDAELQILTKRPITASQGELVSNPRARSAKLRAAAKIKTKQKG